MPPEVVKLLDLENLESSFISEKLKQEQTDLLFQVWKQNECVSTF
ncbi:Rpn family recombination-promoting nuclease/putative transposase [Leptospira interrogans]|nr:Rpn family recombination-promoting nuclease/putative transposase [Leptospira interrogans]